MFEDPKTAIWMVQDGDGSAFGRSDLVIVSFKIDGVVIVDSADAAQREGP
jgi:hypothetical protein